MRHALDSGLHEASTDFHCMQTEASGDFALRSVQGSSSRGMDRASANLRIRFLQKRPRHSAGSEFLSPPAAQLHRQEIGNPSRADQVLSCLSYEAWSHFRFVCGSLLKLLHQDLQRSNALPPPLSAAERKSLYKAGITWHLGEPNSCTMRAAPARNCFNKLFVRTACLQGAF